MSATNSAAATTTGDQQPRTLAQHLSVDPTTLTSLGLCPNQPISEIDADTMTIIQETLRLNGLEQVQPFRRRRLGQHPPRTTGALVPSRSGGLRRLQRRGGAVFEVEPRERPMHAEVMMSEEDVMGLVGNLHGDDVTMPMQRRSARELVFEIWDRVGDRSRATTWPRNGLRRESTGSEDEEEQQPQDALTYEGRQAAEDVGLRFLEEATWGRR